VASLNGIAAVISPLFMTQLFSYFSSLPSRLFLVRRTWSRACWCCFACWSARARANGGIGGNRRQRARRRPLTGLP
jgi:hypothetical protein